MPPQHKTYINQANTNRSTHTISLQLTSNTVVITCQKQTSNNNNNNNKLEQSQFDEKNFKCKILIENKIQNTHTHFVFFSFFVSSSSS